MASSSSGLSECHSKRQDDYFRFSRGTTTRSFIIITSSLLGNESDLVEIGLFLWEAVRVVGRFIETTATLEPSVLRGVFFPPQVFPSQFRRNAWVIWQPVSVRNIHACLKVMGGKYRGRRFACGLLCELRRA